MNFEQPKQNNPEKEFYVGDTIKRMDEERKKSKIEYAEKQRQIHEATGWELVSDKPETVTEKRNSEDIKHEYREKNRDKDFWQIDLVPESGSETMAYYAKPGDSYHVYMRTKEEAEKSKERHKKAREELVKTINAILKELGFKKKASTWRREAGGLVQVFNLMTHRFAYEYFINIGVFIRERDRDKPVEKIDELDCHYKWRLEDFVPKKADKMNYQETMDFEAIPNEYEGEPPERQQIEKIKDYIEQYAVPFFEETETEEKIKEFIAKNELERSEERAKEFTEEIRKMRGEKEKK